MQEFCYDSCMTTNINQLFKTNKALLDLVIDLKQELINERLKNAYLLEQFRLAKQERFAPRSEKNIYQADLFANIKRDFR